MLQGSAPTKASKQGAINGGESAASLNNSNNQLAQQQQSLLLQQQQQIQAAAAAQQSLQLQASQQQSQLQASSQQPQVGGGAQNNGTAASALAGIGATAVSSTIGSGTTNQQRLKSHVQQFVNKIRKESDKFYKMFVEVCKNNRDTDRCQDFHSEIGKLFSPYGDITSEINKMLHQDFQFKIPDQSQNTTLKGSEISNDNIQRADQMNPQSSPANNLSNIINNTGQSIAKGASSEGQYRNNNNSGNTKNDASQNANDTTAGNNNNKNNRIVQDDNSNRQPANQKEIVTQKLQQFCLVIKQYCPEKMAEFVKALREKRNGQDDQLKLFIQTCLDIFGEDHSIYQKAQTLFKDQVTIGKQTNDENPDNEIQPSGQIPIEGVSIGGPKIKQRKTKNKLQNISTSNNNNNANINNNGNDVNASTNVSTKGNNSSSNNNNNNINSTNSNQANTNNATANNSANQNNPLLSGVTNQNGYIKGSNANNTATNHSNTPNANNLNVPSTNANYRAPSARVNDMQQEFPHSITRNNLSTTAYDQDAFPTRDRIMNISGATRNEQNFIYLIDTHMDPIAFMNMLKLLYLYVECIITASEMIEQGSYLLQGFNNPDKLIEQLKDLVECRESSRRKATPYFKPLNDFDFNHHERFTHSYVEMPKFYPKYCSNSTELTKSVLNTSIVTVPQGTEHVTFSIMRKNQYEEQLFKSEDEKYEFDHHIQMYRRTIKLLEKVESCEDLEQSRRIMQQAIDLKMIICLYKNGSPEQQEICDILLSNPKKTVVVALERVRSKLREIEEAKQNQAKKQWHEVAEKNFHRSLDHRSFIFKRHDRKFTLSTRFEKEPEFRNRMVMRVSSYLTHKQQQQQQLQFQIQQQQQLLSQQQGSTRSAGAAMAIKAQHLNDDGIENNQDFETDVSQYFQFLNTFQGTTNIEKCSHAANEPAIKKFDFMNTPLKIALPMMTFIFEDPDICEDTFSLLMHYQLYVAINQSEREKIKRTAQMVLKGFFGLQFKTIEQTDITLNENKTIKVVTEIENKIFEKIYAYLRPINRDGSIIDAFQSTNDKSAKGQDGEPIEEETTYNDAKEAKQASEKSKNDNKNEDDEDAEDEEEDKDNQNGEDKSGKVEKQKATENGEESSSKPNVSTTKGKTTKSPSSFHIQSASKKQQSKDSNDTEMEIENDGNQRKQKSQESAGAGEEPSPTGENNQTNSNSTNNQSSLNEILDDENSKGGGETVREMNYIMENINENIYLPQQDQEKMQAFYGTKSMYIFLRFFYVLYERLFKAQEISRYFEDNEKTCKLSEQEKEEISRERYSTFKNILIGSLKQRETKYEDYLRSIFGKQAFLLFTIDKTLQSATKSLQVLASDELSQKLLQLYIHPEEFHLRSTLSPREETLYVKINKIILDSTFKNNTNSNSDARSFFRFTRDKCSNILYINYIDSYYKNWDVDQINKSRDYFTHYMTEPTPLTQNKTHNSELPIYLSRNKQKNVDKIKSKQLQIFQQNNIEYLAYPNTNHIISANNGKEDYLVSSSKLKRRAVPLEQVLVAEYKKKVKFDEWYNKQTESIIQYKNASSSQQASSSCSKSTEPKKIVKNTTSPIAASNTPQNIVSDDKNHSDSSQKNLTSSAVKQQQQQQQLQQQPTTTTITTTTTPSVTSTQADKSAVVTDNKINNNTDANISLTAVSASSTEMKCE